MYSFWSSRLLFLMYFSIVWNFFPGMFVMIFDASWSLRIGHGRAFEMMTLFSSKFMKKWLNVLVFLLVGMVIFCFRLKFHQSSVSCNGSWLFDVVNICMSSNNDSFIPDTGYYRENSFQFFCPFQFFSFIPYLDFSKWGNHWLGVSMSQCWGVQYILFWMCDCYHIHFCR